jgi:hypothetical protein
MPEGLPEFLSQGEIARLIPVCAASQKERAACSVLLAALRIVQPFARDLLSEMGKRVGSWASVEAYTEVVFQNQPDERCRPDGLIIFDTVRRQWKALVEAKIGLGKISPEQIRRYYQLAQANGIDAIITISNELNPRPQHIPYDVPKEVIGNIELYHWSWPHLGMIADRLLREEEDFDDEQYFILREVVRYLESETSEGGFQQMGSDWPHLNQKIFSNGEISGNDSDVLSAIKNWHQHESSICIWLGRELQRHVSLHLNRSHKESQTVRLLEDAEQFVATKQLRASFHCSALAGPIELAADALRRNVTCRCSIEAPQHKRRYQSRIGWLLEQLPDGRFRDTMVHIAWNDGQKTCVSLDKLRKDLNEGRIDGALPVAFELSKSFDLGQRFAGSRIFVEAVDSAVWSFCDSIARHLRQPPPVREQDDSEQERSDQESAQAQCEEVSIKTDVPHDEPVIREMPSSNDNRDVVQEADIPGGHVKVFDDGSIELQTGARTTWYRNFAELERALHGRAAGSTETNGGTSDHASNRRDDDASTEGTSSAASPSGVPETH